MDTLRLATKVQGPPRPQHGVRRTRLISALAGDLPHYKLLLISTPAGYGKTTLLAQWAHASRFRVAWSSISEENNEMERFLRYLLAAWEKIQPDVRGSPLGLLLSDLSPDIETVLSVFINLAKGVPDHLAFVLDDCHLCSTIVI